MKLFGREFHLFIPEDEMGYEEGARRAQELFAKEQRGERLTFREKFEIWNDNTIYHVIHGLRERHRNNLDT